MEFSVNSDEIGNAKITVCWQEIEYVTFDDPFIDFKGYLKGHSNNKILFSAPFGHGKTTFLKLFFDKNTKYFNHIHLFPVNYSVAQNRDIFEYIKCDILFSLLERGDIEFDKEKFKHLKTLPLFLQNNIIKLLAPFVNLVPKVGKGVFTIIQELTKLYEEYSNTHEQVQIDDESNAITFIERVYNEAGSIYEDNFQTQLVRQLLERLKESTNKENVLVIDDLDRMDPDHVFRILNIFSAHFDSSDNIYESNKFGFDKIIIVCDYSNLAKIFAHKFGEHTDFAGYINKFFSSNIYFYNNLKVCMKVIKWIEDSQSFLNNTLVIILKDLVKTQNLSLRELIKIKDLKLDRLNNQFDPTLNLRDNTYQYHYLNIAKLINVMDISVLKKKIKACGDKTNSVKHNRKQYDFLSKSLIAELLLKKGTQKNYAFYYEGNEYIVVLDDIQMDNFIVKSIKSASNENTQIQFEKSDFYNLFLQLIEESREAFMLI